VTTTVLAGGRVIDPASGRDEMTDVLLDGDRVAAVGPALRGDTTIDVAGLLVGPGFVDLHSHVQSVAGQRLQAFDGVTTSLELEAGLYPVEAAYAAAAAEGRPLHYGFSASWGGARAAVLLGHGVQSDVVAALAVLGEPEWQRDSSPAELDRWLGLLREEIGAGALGVGILQGYAPRTDPREFLAVARVAADLGVPTYTHVRELVEADPTTPIDGSEEIVRAAAETGARMHHCHVGSTSRRHVDRVLRLLERATNEGSRVTVETYPYGAGATGIGAAFLAPERLGAWDLTPSSLVLLPSGERIADAARLGEVRATAPGTACIVEFLDEDDPADRALLDAALAFPDAIVASDAMPVLWADGSFDSREWPLPSGGSTHPRTAGNFTRTLRRMVRETGTWTWVEAFRRCSSLPARLLDEVAPAARGKGWLGPGADTDLVVLDPAAVTDVATYLDPARPSAGVRHLLVAGTPVIRDGELLGDAYPGRALRGQH